MTGRVELSPLAIRVTHISLREEGSWKIIDRYDNTIIEKVQARAVLQRQIS